MQDVHSTPILRVEKYTEYLKYVEDFDVIVFVCSFACLFVCICLVFRLFVCSFACSLDRLLVCVNGWMGAGDEFVGAWVRGSVWG